MAKKKTAGIVLPREALPEGIRLALDRSRVLLEAAAHLARSPHLTGAAVLFSQGVEELGKAAMLQDARVSTSAPTVNVPGFLDHQVKLTKAAGLLSESALMLGGYFDAENYFDGDAYFGESPAEDWLVRLDLLYAGWDESRNEWRGYSQVNADVVEANIRSVLALIAKKRSEWSD